MPADLIVNCTVVVSLLFWGAWGVFDKKALHLGSPITQLLAVYLCSPVMVVCSLLVLPMIRPECHLSAHTLFWGLLSSLSYFVATGSYLVAMARKDASLIIGITACYPVVSQILAVLILGEPFVPARFLGCLILVSGVIALSRSGSANTEPAQVNVGSNRPLVLAGHGSKFQDALDKSALDPKNRLPVPTKAAKKWELIIIAVAVAVAVCGWALRGIFDKIALASAHPVELFLAKYSIDSLLGLAALAVVFVAKKAPKQVNAKALPFALGSALCLAAGSAGYYVALSMAPASYVVAITGCYPLVLYGLALMFLNEKFNKSRVLGLLLITAGGIITQITQGA